MTTIIKVVFWSLVMLAVAGSTEGCKKGSPSEPNAPPEEVVPEESREYEETEDQEIWEAEPDNQALPED